MGRIGQHSTESKECEEDQLEPHVKRRRQSRPTRQYLEDVIESLGNRFDCKCEETKLFPPQISAKLEEKLYPCIPRSDIRTSSTNSGMRGFCSAHIRRGFHVITVRG